MVRTEPSPNLIELRQLNNFGNEARDPESGEPPPRRVSWYRSFSVYSNPLSGGYGGASIRSIVSHWSIDFVARWSPRSRQASDRLNTPATPSSNARDKFIAAILGEQPRVELQPTCIWFTGLLECRIREAWIPLFSPVLKSSNGLEETPSCGDPAAAFLILEVIVLELAQKDVTLTDMVDKLYNNNMLVETDHLRSHANQLVVAAFGWISSLYTATLDPQPRMLQIIDPYGSTTAGERKNCHRKGKTFTNYEQGFENRDQPFYSLLRAFGNVIPKPVKQQLSHGQLTPAPAPTRPDEEWIELSLVCFNTLSKVTHIKIEWVDSLSMHLEFDSYSKVLHIFRLPSLCLLMCSCKNRSPLSQLFSDSNESRSFHELFTDSTEVEDASEFYKEVLLTYRLIFGQDQSSYKHFKALKKSKMGLPGGYQDPLLLALCGHSWESAEARQTYEMIRAEDPSTHYSPAIDFPFLGKRLLALQKYVRGHDSRTFWALWYDRRNPLTWWTFWAVILLGGISLILTIVLGILQTVLGILQVKYAKEQLAPH